MSNSSDFPESGNFSGWKPVRTSATTSFLDTSNVLSQHGKERGSFRDLCLGIGSDLERKEKFEKNRQLQTMDLLPRMDAPSVISTKEGLQETNHNHKSMDLFPPRSTLESPTLVEDSRRRSDVRTANVPGSSQLTIFYSGRVMVFDNFPSDKAREIMLLASRTSAQISALVSSSGNDKPNCPKPNCDSTSGSPVNTALMTEIQSDVSDLPIARKNSLHRFLEKRKGRISKAPYQTNASVSTPLDPEKDNKSWLGIPSKD